MTLATLPTKELQTRLKFLRSLHSVTGQDREDRDSDIEEIQHILSDRIKQSIDKLHQTMNPKSKPRGTKHNVTAGHGGDFNNKYFSIGVLGYSAQKFDVMKAGTLIKKGFIDLISKYNTDFKPVEIVSGLTDVGIPAIAYHLAKHYKYRTIGIAPWIALDPEEDFPIYPVDDQQIIGDTWGEESKHFVNYCDVFLRVGGGKQSHQEITLAKQLKKPTLEFELVEGHTVKPVIKSPIEQPVDSTPSFRVMPTR